MDNGSEFKGDVPELLGQYLVVPLLSPAYWPQYNGSVEAGMGPLKTKMYHEAMRHGRSGEWSSDDLEHARWQINTAPRPVLVRRFNLPAGLATPQLIWQTRKPITKDQRLEFIETVNVKREEVMEEFKEAGEDINKRQLATVARESISRALVALGYLKVRRKRITPPFNLKKMGIIR